MTIASIPAIACVAAISAIFSTYPSQATSDTLPTDHSERQLDSLARQLGRKLSNVTTAEVEERKQTRREVQRKGYQNTLMEILFGDSLGAIFAFLKMNLQIEFFLPHNTIYIEQRFEKMYFAVPYVLKYEDGTELIFETKKVKLALKEDWTFPVDPWKREDK